MNDRRARWNDRHRRGEETPDNHPSSPLPEALKYLDLGPHEDPGQRPRALDVACGAGRHSLYLAQHGCLVTAVDWSETGLSVLASEAARLGLSDRIELVTADLEAGEYTPSAAAFDLVADFYFLSRPLFPALRDAVKPGGLFVAAIHVESPGAAAPHRFLLAPGELAATVAAWGFEILHGREGLSAAGHVGTASPGGAHASEIIARRP